MEKLLEDITRQHNLTLPIINVFNITEAADVNYIVHWKAYKTRNHLYLLYAEGTFTRTCSDQKTPANEHIHRIHLMKLKANGDIDSTEHLSSDYKPFKFSPIHESEHRQRWLDILDFDTELVQLVQDVWIVDG